MYTRDKEIRLLPSNHIDELARILDLNDSWKKLMGIIPKIAFSKLPTDRYSYKYNINDEQLLEKACNQQKRLGAEMLFDEWGTSGKIRPTLGLLLDLLVKAQLFRAADLVATKFLNEPPPARPSKGPAAKIDIPFTLVNSKLNQNVEDVLDNGDYPGTQTVNDNANPSRLADNNIDYYEKYTPNKKRLSISIQSNGKHIPIPPGIGNNSEARPQSLHSDFMKFSSASVTDSNEVIPMLSDLLPSTSAQSDSNNCSNSVVKDQLQSSVDIPMLSALQSQSSLSGIIPNLSALNVHDAAHLDNGDLKLPLDDLSPSTQSSTSTSTISSSPDDDEGNDISAPNLSILDQRSSNNDSSLTNVTATSEDNSFDTSLNEGSTSYDNIPCLSALK